MSGNMDGNDVIVRTLRDLLDRDEPVFGPVLPDGSEPPETFEDIFSGGDTVDDFDMPRVGSGFGTRPRPPFRPFGSAARKLGNPPAAARTGDGDCATRGHVRVQRLVRTVLGRPVAVTLRNADALRWAARDGAAFYVEGGRTAVVGACLSSAAPSAAPQPPADAGALWALARHRLLRLPEAAWSGPFGTYAVSSVAKRTGTGDGLVPESKDTRPATVSTVLMDGHVVPSRDFRRIVGEPLAVALHANRCVFSLHGDRWFVGVARLVGDWLVTEEHLAEFRLHAGREWPALSQALASAADPSALSRALAAAPRGLSLVAAASLSDPDAGGAP